MTENSNIAKGKLIKRSLSHCKIAVKEGFYLEAISLSDSLISECINRIQFFSSDSNFSVKGINDGVRKIGIHGIQLLDFDLSADTLAWGKNRNAAIHGFTKLNEFQGLTWEARREFIQPQAELGLALAKRWLREASKHKI